MLGKLIKYDLKSMLKTMVPLWLTVIALSTIICIKFWGSSANVVNVSSNTVDLALFMILFAVGMAIIVFNTVFVIQRFWNGLLKEEGYLMFTLPVTTRSLIIGKALSALIISLGSLLVAVICVVIVSFAFVEGVIGKEDISALWMATRNALQLLKPSQAAGFLFYLIVGLVSFLSGIYQVYASMAIGQLSNKNRFLASFFAFVGISVVFGFITSFTDMISVNNPYVEDGIVLIIDLITVVALHIITEVLLTKKLNLE